MSIIYHIATRAAWRAALDSGSYRAASLAAEGFIHCSTLHQVVATANRLFKGRPDLILLGIDTDQVLAEIRFENLEGGSELYPHVYGAIDRAWIAATHDFPAGGDGCFELPPALR